MLRIFKETCRQLNTVRNNKEKDKTLVPGKPSIAYTPAHIHGEPNYDTNGEPSIAYTVGALDNSDCDTPLNTNGGPSIAYTNGALDNQDCDTPLNDGALNTNGRPSIACTLGALDSNTLNARGEPHSTTGVPSMSVDHNVSNKRKRIHERECSKKEGALITESNLSKSEIAGLKSLKK